MIGNDMNRSRLQVNRILGAHKASVQIRPGVSLDRFAWAFFMNTIASCFTSPYPYMVKACKVNELDRRRVLFSNTCRNGHLPKPGAGLKHSNKVEVLACYFSLTQPAPRTARAFFMSLSTMCGKSCDCVMRSHLPLIGECWPHAMRFCKGILANEWAFYEHEVRYE